MSQRTELDILEEHIVKRGLKRSQKRDRIVKVFLNSEQHLSVEDLFLLVKKQDPDIGYTTVYRTVKLIMDSGIAETVDFNDGVKRFERKLGREYHAHFICTECGNNFEVFDKNIENLSSRLAKDQGFYPQKHRLEIFGTCKNCSR